MKNTLTLIALTGAITLFILCLLPSSWADAQSDDRHNGRDCSLSFVYENDQLFDDINYSFGMLVAKNCSFPANDLDMDSDDSIWRLPHILNKALARRFRIHAPGRHYVANSLYGHLSLYTPNDITQRPPLVKGDGRPYASTLVYGDSVIFLNDKDHIALKQGIQLGLLGLSVGGNLQRAVHKLMTLDLPEGWSSQISDGGEPIFLYSLQRKALLCGAGNRCGNGIFELTTNLGGGVGYYNGLRGGLSIRLGLIDSPFWADFAPISGHMFQPERFGNGPVSEPKRSMFQPESYKNRPVPELTRITGSESATTQSSMFVVPEAYLFLTGSAHLVLYSTLLQGQGRHNPYEIRASEVETLVPQVMVGFVIQVGRLRFSFSHSYRGPEIKEGREHMWSSLTLGCVY